jgi:hypothetical protein
VCKYLRFSAAFAALLLSITFASIPVQAAQQPPDATLYTSYFFYGNYQNVDWVVCGSTAETSGCFGSGTLGPFGQIGTMLEGIPSVNYQTDTVTRQIYVVDQAAGTQENEVLLYVYKKVDVVTASTDTVKVTLLKTVTLPLTGGTTAQSFIAANSDFLFVGTNQTAEAVEVRKSDFSIETIGGFSPPINVSAITSDQYGYVSVTFGTGDETGNVEIGPNGESVGDGGGAWFMLNTNLGVAVPTIPNSSSQAPQVGYHFKDSQR